MTDIAWSTKLARQGGQIIVFHDYARGDETAATTKKEWMITFAGTIVEVICDAATAPAGSTSIIDVNINGTTIYTTQANRPILPADDTGQYTQLLNPEITALRPGDILSYDVDQIGSGTAATRFMISIICRAH